MIANRSLFVLVALTCVLTLGGFEELQAGESANGWDPDALNPGAEWSEPGYQGLPDLKRDSAKFLVLNGVRSQNQSFEGSGIGRGIFQLNFESGVTDVRIALFDGDTSGLWDQRAGDSLLLFAPRVDYDIFADPDGDVAAALVALGEAPLPPALQAQLIRTVTSDDLTDGDNKWCAMFDEQVADPDVQKGLTTSGDYRFTVRVTLVSIAMQGTDRCGYKIAFNGTYLLPAGGVLGFGGGVVDQRFLITAMDQTIPDSRDPMPGEPIPGTQFFNEYDGDFSFLFNSSAAKMGDLEFYEGDADWNAPIGEGNVDTAPTGVPPDQNPHANDAGVVAGEHIITIRPEKAGLPPLGYVAPVIPMRDSSGFAISPSIRWFIFPTDNETAILHPENAAFPGPLFSSDAYTPPNPNRSTPPPLWPNHPSISVLYQCVPSLAPQVHVHEDVWQKYVLDQPTMLSQQGSWTLRWFGVDSSNFVFISFNKDVGTTVTQNLRGHCFCDDNGSTTYEEEFDSDPPEPCTVSIQQVDPNNGDAPIGAPFEVVSDASGFWGPVDVDPGTYLISLVGDLGATVDLPIRVEVPEGGCPEVEIPLECKFGPICGWVYCEDGDNCCYDELFDRFLPAPYLPATVVVTPIAPPGDPFEVMTDEEGHYCTDKLPAGTYLVSVKPGTIPFPIADNDCPPAHTVIVESGAGQIDDICFPYECDPPEVCGRIWCDDIMNDRFDPGELPLTVDVPMLGDIWSVEITKTGSPAFLETVFPDANGAWCFKFDMDGEYSFTVLYNGTTDYPPQTVIQNPGTQVRDVKAGEDDPDDVLHTFKCPGRVCGKVYCSPICRPNGGVGPYNADNGDMLLEGAIVTLTDALGNKRTEITDENGEYCFKLVLLGRYTITVEIPDALKLLKNITSDSTPASRTVDIDEAFQDVLDQDFGYCCPPEEAELCIRIFCDDDCDGILDRGEPSYPGLTVELFDVNNNVVRTYTSVAGPVPDEVCWTNLPAGIYTVRVDGTTVPPGATITVGDGEIVILGPGDVITVDVGICKPGEICGHVFVDPKGDCDGIFQESDRRIEGVDIHLSGGDIIGFLATFTDADGYYCFKNLKPGMYTVEIQLGVPPALRNVTLGTAQKVEVEVVSQETEIVDFGFCIQQICGKVWKEPEEYCDGEFNVQFGDELIEGLEIELWGTDDLGNEVHRTTTTNEDGEYCFKLLPTGTYEVIVSDAASNVPILVDLTAQEPTLHLIDLKLGECIDDVDFYYCECTQRVCVKVFVEKGKDCDGEFDDGIDECLAWVQIFVKKPGADTYLTFDFTDEDGIVCFDLPPGRYKVYVGANQDRTYGLRPCNVKNDCPSTYIELEPCEKEKLYFCFCRECPKQPCCEGKLHEVVFDAKIWVGECLNDCFAVSAHLYADCDDKYAGFYDEVWMDYCDDFPGPRTGAEGVLTIEDVKILNGVAVVRVRMKAVGWDLHGYFPDEKLPISVYVNGKSVRACVKFRCETMRPGAVFEWTPDCGKQPECVEPEGYVWDRYWNWFYCDDCPADFIVLDSLSYESWRSCNPCDPDPKYKDICLSYDGSGGDLHEIILKLKAGREVLELIKMEFDGHSWSGDMGGPNGHMTLLKVWKDDGDCWKAKIRIYYDCGCLEDWMPETIKVWSKLDECTIDKRVHLICEDLVR